MRDPLWKKPLLIAAGAGAIAYIVTRLVTAARPDPERTRRNAYWRMFGSE